MIFPKSLGHHQDHIHKSNLFHNFKTMALGPVIISPMHPEVVVFPAAMLHADFSQIH